MSYFETIAALKDFTAAQRRLDAAEKVWDDSRWALNDQYDGEKFQFCFIMGSDYLGAKAREFLSAYNAYDRLSYVMPSPALSGRDLEAKHYVKGLCELGR
jgi:hypothetical protein